MRLVVADSGPLIALARIGRLDLLLKVVEQVLVPHTVAEECTRDPEKPGARAIRMALQSRLLQEAADPDTTALAAALVQADPGELAAIALAATFPAPVLIDDAVARRIARAHGVKVIGTAGMLLRAKHAGAVGSIAPLLAQMRANGYFLSDALIGEVLRRSGEPSP
jgi:hypothetical protein